MLSNSFQIYKNRILQCNPNGYSSVNFSNGDFQVPQNIISEAPSFLSDILYLVEYSNSIVSYLRPVQ